MTTFSKQAELDFMHNYTFERGESWRELQKQ